MTFLKQQFCLLFVALLLAAPLLAQDGKATSQPTSKPAKVDEDPNDAQAVAIIDRYLESIGSKKTLESLKDKSVRFLNKKFSPTGVTEMKMARFMKGHYMIREEWELPGMGLTKPGEPLRFLQIYDGEKAWVKAMGYVSPLTGKTLNVFVWDKFIDDPFMHWFDDGYTCKYKGEESVDDVVVQRIELKNFAGTQTIKYFFTKSDGLLARKEWRSVGQTGKVNKELYYDQYTKIRLGDDPEKWIQFATNTKVFIDGELDLETEYTSIKFNTGLDNSAFHRPDGPDFEEHRKKKAAERAAAKSQPSSQPSSKPSSQPTSKKGR